ncbi:hypothetical protein [Pseudomonas sp. Ga0074129]|uniref:hypothetical protein n=1 Tax=Pseudomonas sp. Ga0074129 TaxID=1752219 RepID=UPI0025E5307E|nr:hypothetical protein [Pseudomonas sp. Ga0074129]
MPTERQKLVAHHVIGLEKSISATAKQIGASPTSVRGSLISYCIKMMPSLEPELTAWVEHKDRGRHRLAVIRAHKDQLMPSVDQPTRRKPMSEEQQAVETAADNCEVLRARLARYEDADGKPITTIAEQAREIERLQLTCNDIDDQNDRIYAELAALKAKPDPWKASGADWCNSIHSNPDAKAWADFFVAVFPGQADKHELMIGWFANAMMAMHDHLKAQQGGVVLPERKTWNQVTGREGFIETETHNACLDEVARLNSSPVSAGDDAQYPPCDYCAEPLSYHPWHGSGLINGVESRHIHACDKCRHLLPTVSAGDDRETIRAVFLRNGFTIKEGQADLKPYVYAAADELMSIARAALSAPSHGEQAREWNLAADELPANGKPVLAYYLNSHGMGRRIRAMHVKRFTVEAEEFADPDTQCCEYSEQDDCYYTTEGWYELIDNWPDYASCAVIEGVITHWTDMPEAPSPASHKEQGE